MTSDLANEKREGVSLLVVEDSAVQRVMLQRLLAKAGFTLLSAKDGLEGLETVQEHRPSLVISDIAMPNMDGYEMCRAIKHDPNLRHIPVLLLTSLDDPKEVIRALDAGADNYLTKPVDDAHLLERIQSLLEDSEDDPDVGRLESLRISFSGETHLITAGRRQTMNLLLSTYENAVRKNQELIQAQSALRLLTEHLEDEVKRRTRQLEVANRVKTEFISNMSHEVRTPMNAIIGMTDLLWDSTLEKQQREMLDIARVAASNLMLLLDGLLDFSLMENGEIELQQDMFFLRQTLQSFATPFLRSVQDKGLAFSCQVDADVPDGLVGDFPRLGQILNQLLGNALKFTEKGSIHLEVSRKSSSDDRVNLCFSVTDTGIGIAPEQQEWVFESFSQGDGSHTRKYGGTGLGLSLAKRLSEIMESQLTFESEQGKGSVFYLCAPFLYDANHAANRAKISDVGDGFLLQTESTVSIPTFRGDNPSSGSFTTPLEECHRLFDLCEQSIETGRMENVDRWVASLKEIARQLPPERGKDLSNNLLRMVMATRGGDVDKASECLKHARGSLAASDL